MHHGVPLRLPLKTLYRKTNWTHSTVLQYTVEVYRKLIKLERSLVRIFRKITLCYVTVKMTMGFCARTFLLCLGMFLFSGMMGITITAFVFEIWPLGVIMSFSTILSMMPIWLCIKKWLDAKERRMLGIRERKRLKRARKRYDDEIFEVLREFISSTDVVHIICTKYLDEVEDQLVINIYNINAEYLEYR